MCNGMDSASVILTHWFHIMFVKLHSGCNPAEKSWSSSFEEYKHYRDKPLTSPYKVNTLSMISTLCKLKLYGLFALCLADQVVSCTGCVFIGRSIHDKGSL